MTVWSGKVLAKARKEDNSSPKASTKEWAMVPTGGGRAKRLLDAQGWKTWEREEDYLVYAFPLERLEAYRTA